ncbi:alpha/beta fold hydrolase [Amnibacterium sp.]|uniref:alpha/beta hydrolase n=1 Tax=Amnibacterium sp. TaxID=1872496 RepID=UPI002638978E|nr:alpha/beta fold hydrolase [Amnibacterium sp.]MCU1474227.1 putative hydrolase or acyltransferase (Alpha/beta hydrolase superfamily) [Amnibacterium sp.]
MDRFLDRPEGRIAFSESGPADARALIATHEPTGSRTDEDAWGVFDWSAVAAAGQRLIRYDLRGHGASVGRAEQSDFSWPALAQDLLALADRASPDRRVDLLGVATGCGTVLRAALRAPERVRRLVLVIPPPIGADRERQAQLYRAAADLAEVRGIDAWVRAASGMPAVPVLVEGGWRRPSVPGVSEALLPLVVRADADSALPSDYELAELPQQTLLLAWTGDASHPIASAERLATVLAAARCEVADSAATVAGWGMRVAAFLRDGLPDGGHPAARAAST